MNSRESIFSGFSSANPASKHGLAADTQEMQSIISSWKTPLHIAASEGRCDQLNLLLEHPNININLQTKRYNEYEGTIKLDNTPLHLAAQNGQEQAVSILLKNGALCHIQNSEGATPLHLATINGASYEVVYNLAKDRDTLLIKDKRGRTALFCAAFEGWHNLIPILADSENIIEETDIVGETPLIIATKNGFSQTMKVLIEMGAYLSKRDKIGNSAIDYALRADEKSIQDEQIFDDILSQMLKSQSKEIALSHLQNLLTKYNRIKLKQSIFSLFDRIPELRAIKVIIHSRYLESDKNGFTPDHKNYERRATTALQMIADTKDVDLAFHPCIRTVVNKKMSKIGNYFLLLEIIYYLVFLFCMGFSFIAAAGRSDPMKYDLPSDYVRAAFECIVIVLWISFVFSFILGIFTSVTWEYHRGMGANKDKNKVKKTSIQKVLIRSLRNLASDAYNYYSLFWIIFLFLVVPFRITSSPIQWIFAVFAVTFGFLRLIKIIRLLPGFGTYVHTITLIIYYDVPKFLLVCLTLILVLSECFFISLRVPHSLNMKDNISTAELGEQGITSEIHWTILSFIRIMLEAQSILEHNYLSNHLNWLSSIIYLFGLMLLIIILINIFIAQVSDTYASSKSKSERVVALYRLEYIVRLTVKTFGFSRKKGYVNDITLKGNYWRSLQKGSDELYADMMIQLEKQQSNFDQLKQYISTLKKVAQTLNENNLRSSIASGCGDMYNSGVTPDILEHEV